MFHLDVWPLFIMGLVCMLRNDIIDACTVNNHDFIQTIVVQEEINPGTVIGRLDLDDPSTVLSVSVKDPNPYFSLSGPKEFQRYEFEQQRRIDIEAGVNKLQILTLKCITTSGVELEVEIEFEIKDINDHEPTFDPNNSYNFSISEQTVIGTKLGVLKVSDKDANNWNIEYELISKIPTFQDKFSLKPIGGGVEIILSQPLDFESQHSYNFLLTAKDCQERQNCNLNQKTNSVNIIIIVIDADDLNPEFDQPSYQVVLSDDSRNGDFVVQVRATDKDSLNHSVIYSLAGEGKEYFSINSSSGIVIVKDLEGIAIGANYLLQVKATQTTNENRKDTATLFISVVASGSDIPQFSEEEHTVSISEYMRAKTSILSMGIIYNNKVEPLKAEIIDVFPNGCADIFEVVFSGKHMDLIMNKAVDYEVIKEYHFIIKVFNRKHSSKARVTVKVLNENDNSPHFEQMNYKFTVSDATNGLVGTVRAHDADLQGQVKYYLLDSDFSDLFKINEDNGTIYIKQIPANLTKKEYTLIIEAKDDGIPERSANAVISIHLSEKEKFEELSSSSTGNSGMTIIPVIAGSAAAVLVIALIITIVACRKCKARMSMVQQNSKKTRNGLPLPVDDSHYSLGSGNCKQDMLIRHDERECTYRDMSELNADDDYKALWNGQHTQDESEVFLQRVSPLSQHKISINGSDSGRSSADDYNCSHSIHDSTLGKDNDAGSRAVQGYIGSLMRKHRENSLLKYNMPNGEPLLVEAPQQFRSGGDFRSTSPTSSTHSDDSESSTSDYGSNIAASDHQTPVMSNKTLVQGSTSRNNKDIPLSTLVTISSNKKVRVESIDLLEDSAMYKPFTTFHGDHV